MSKWLKSTTQKAWTVGLEGKQFIIPQNVTPDNRWLQVGDDEMAAIAALPVISSLIKAGGITVLNEEPAELRNSVPQLQVTNTQLQAELDTARQKILQLEEQLKNTSGIDVEAIKAEVRQQCEAEKQAALKELDDTATREIEARDKTIEKLEKKIKKLGGESEE